METTTISPQLQPLVYAAVSFNGSYFGMNLYAFGAPCADCLRENGGDPMFNAQPPCSRADGHAAADVSNWGNGAALFEVRATDLDEARAMVHSILAACPTTGYKAPDLPRGCAWSDAEPGYVHAASAYATSPGRRILAGQWPAPSPAECAETSGQGVWITDDSTEILICPGCGLDCT